VPWPAIAPSPSRSCQQGRRRRCHGGATRRRPRRAYHRTTHASRRRTAEARSVSPLALAPQSWCSHRWCHGARPPSASGARRCGTSACRRRITAGPLCFAPRSWVSARYRRRSAAWRRGWRATTHAMPWLWLLGVVLPAAALSTVSSLPDDAGERRAQRRTVTVTGPSAVAARCAQPDAPNFAAVATDLHPADHREADALDRRRPPAACRLADRPGGSPAPVARCGWAVLNGERSSTTRRRFLHQVAHRVGADLVATRSTWCRQISTCTVTGRRASARSTEPAWGRASPCCRSRRCRPPAAAAPERCPDHWWLRG
jgi:hypothetical protein